MLSELFDLLQEIPLSNSGSRRREGKILVWRCNDKPTNPQTYLRDYTEKDFEAYSRLKMDAETMYYLQDIQLYSVEEARRDFAEVLSDMKSRSGNSISVTWS